MVSGKIIVNLLLCAFLGLCACGQTNTPQQVATTDLFVGSTPSDSLIMAMLQIPPGTKSTFMKWELHLQNRKAGKGQFEAIVFYGVDKPGTNGFMDGGTRLALTGTYTLQNGAAANAKAKVYHLQAAQLSALLLLIEMDNNILHFLTPDKHFIVGNGGFGYVLNRIQ